jgi:hypothetical protein
MPAQPSKAAAPRATADASETAVSGQAATAMTSCARGGRVRAQGACPSVCIHRLSIVRGRLNRSKPRPGSQPNPKPGPQPTAAPPLQSWHRLLRVPVGHLPRGHARSRRQPAGPVRRSSVSRAARRRTAGPFLESMPVLNTYPAGACCRLLSACLTLLTGRGALLAWPGDRSVPSKA